jgi:DNA-directed RNA polymerase subunit M/transcription elongation factor TFIIS
MMDFIMKVEEILHTYVKSPKTKIMLKEYLEKISVDENVQKFLLFEVFCHDGIKNIREMFKEKQFLFFHKEFAEIHHLVKEQEEFLTNPVQVEDGVIECHRCKSQKTFSYAKQTRASDEGTTVFVTCSECKHQFRL